MYATKSVKKMRLNFNVLGCACKSTGIAAKIVSENVSHLKRFLSSSFLSCGVLSLTSSLCNRVSGVSVSKSSITFSTLSALWKSQFSQKLVNPRTSKMRSEEHTSELQSLRHLVC